MIRDDKHFNPSSAGALRPLDLSDAEWDHFVDEAPNGHVLQTARWGAFKSHFGWQPARLALGQDGHIVAGALILFRRLPLGQRLAYIPKGPVGPWWEPAVAAPLFHALHALARQRGALALKIEPEERDGSPALATLAMQEFRPAGTVQPRSTIWVDLRGGEEAVRSRMKPKFRYNIGLAERKGIVVRVGSAYDLPAFGRLMAETGGRDGFAIHPPDYYARAYQAFAPGSTCELLLASYADQLLAGLMLFAGAGQAWYMYGASSNAERNRMPNHALQWAALRWAMQHGCHTYDLWGIPDEVGQAPERYQDTVTEREDGLWGVYRFKQGFGGEVVRYAGAYDAIYAPLRYRLYEQALRVRRAAQMG